MARPSGTQRPTAATGRESEAPSVLLADDDGTARTVYGKFFSHAGWHFDIVENGEACIDAASKRNYDVVLTDLMMPGMDGFQVLHSLRQMRPSQAIIVVTGTSNIDQVIAAVREGADDILLKPLDLPMLRHSVERVLDAMRRKFPGNEVADFVTRESVQFQVRARDLGKEHLRSAIVERVVKMANVSRTQRLRLQLAIQEALANSLDHGSLELLSSWKEEFDGEGNDKFSCLKALRLKDPMYGDRRIVITSNLSHGTIEVRVLDEGSGFDVSKHSGESACTREPTASHGRGLALIKGIMDEVRYAEGGRELVMIKSLLKGN